MTEYPIEHPRKIIVSTPDFDCSTNLIELDAESPMTLGHIDVYYWSPSVRKDLMKRWAEVRPLLPPIVFTMGQNPGPKFHKFVSLLGFRPLNEVPCTDGKVRTIYAHFREGL